ncbi:MAG: DUF1192 family protein [Magnetovibrionaceae bacterium]
MDTDDIAPPPVKAAGPKNLDEMSIEALGDYVEALKAEIARAEAAIESKKAARVGAEAFFKPKG